MKLFISTDLNTNTSGDIVATKELEAMQLLASENNEKVIILTSQDIAPTRNGLPDIPFLIDYLTLTRLSNLDDLSNVDLAHMYGGSYTQTVRFLKSKGIKTTYSCMMHDRKISIEEHEKLIGSYPFSHVKDDRLWPMYIGAIKEADIILTPGKVPKELLIKEGAKKVICIQHGCNPPNIDKIKPFPKQFRVGYMGACGPDKGLRYLIEGWSLFIQKYANAGKYNLIGFVPDISDFYNSISLYIQPSASEGFGLETLEAMSYGRPVIVSTGAGSADCVTNGEDGFVVPAMNSRLILEKIDWFKQYPDKIIEFGKKARENSLNYSWNIIKQRYIQIWKNLLK
jgi:glycosyltransferase involved in cell wall biosynthesis